MVSSAAIEVLSLQSSLPSHRLKAFSRRSSDPHVTAASRISPKNPTHGQRQVAWEGTTGGLDDSLTAHHPHTLLPVSSCPSTCPLSSPSQAFSLFQTGALGSSRGCKDRLSPHTPPPRATAPHKKAFFSDACKHARAPLNTRLAAEHRQEPVNLSPPR